MIFTPAVPHNASLRPAGVRARLWLSGRVFVPPDEQVRLWLVLDDGRVLAVRLHNVAFGDERVIEPLLHGVADDLNGEHWQVELAAGYAHILYAAPVLPSPRPHAGLIFDPDWQRFVAALDGDVVRLLLALEHEPCPLPQADGEISRARPQRFFVSVRNYNRLITLTPEVRERRMQALARFPVLVAPILLTAHQALNIWDGKRHAWREKDETIQSVIDQGRDLVGALAQHYGISKGLVRSPLCARMWNTSEHAMRIGWLRLLDALPANQRPSLAEFERWRTYFANYFSLTGENERGHPLPQPPAVHRGAFQQGWTRTWETAARRYGNLHPALADCHDFLSAARERAAALLRRSYGPSATRLAASWLACHGLLGLLAASERWHRQRPVIDTLRDVPDDFRLPVILGHVDDAGRTADELLCPAELAREGEEMRHCVASYWSQCLTGQRIFALRLMNGERSTAQYAPTPCEEQGNDTRYTLKQLRGPLNHEASAEMSVWAHEIEARLNAPERHAARRAAQYAPEQLDMARFKAGKQRRARAHPLDTKSERQLATVLAWLGMQAPTPETLLVARIAGFQYHAGQELMEQLAAGQALELIREPDNLHDRLAVSLNWQSRKLGYVPRQHNTEIALRLDRGERLSARIIATDARLEAWQRVEFVIECGAA